MAVYRQPYMHADTQDESPNGTNKMLLTWIDPFRGAICGIADENVTAAILKSVSVSTVEVVPIDNATVLFVTPFHSPARKVRMYVNDPGGSGFHFLKTIAETEDLAASFRLQRLISAGLQVRSATIGAGSFALNGAMNAILYQELPDIRALSFENLLSYKRDNSNMVGSVPVEEGVTLIALPDDEHEFIIPETENTYSANDVIFTREDGSTFRTPSLTPNTLQLVFTSEDTGNTGFVPPNGWGHLELNLGLTLATVNDPAVLDMNFSVTLQIEYDGANPLTYAPSTTFYGETAFVDAEFPASDTKLVTIPLHYHTYSEAPVKAIQVYVDPRIQAGTYSSCTVDSARTWIEAKWYSINRKGVAGPGGIVALRGLAADQQISLAGVNNYEVVPTSDLARNVPTSYGMNRNPWEFEMAAAVLASAGAFGIKFLYTCREYEALRARQFFEGVTLNQRVEMNASSTRSFIGSILRKIKPVARAVLPVLGGAIGEAAGGPAGLILGQQLGGAGSQMLSASAPQRRMYASTTSHADSSSGTDDSEPECPSSPEEWTPVEHGHIVVDTDGEWHVEQCSPCPIVHHGDLGTTVAEICQGHRCLFPLDDPLTIAALAGTAPLDQLMHEQPGYMTTFQSNMIYRILQFKARQHKEPSGKMYASSTGMNLDEFLAGRRQRQFTRREDPTRVEDSVEGRSYIHARVGGLNRDNALNNERMTALVSGDAEPLRRGFNTIDCAYGSAKFPGIVDDKVVAVRLIVSDRPVQYEWGKTSYNSFDVPGGRIFVSALFEDVAEELMNFLSETPLFAEHAQGVLFISVDNTTGVRRMPVPIAGQSWYAAALVAANMLPNNSLFSGSLWEQITQVDLKVMAAMELNTKIIMLNPQTAEIDAVRQQLTVNNMRLPTFGSGLAINNREIVGFEVKSTSELGWVAALMAAQGGGATISQVAKQVSKEAATMTQKLTADQQSRTKQTVNIKGKETEVDMSGIITEQFIEDHAESFEALKIPEKRFRDLMAAHSYQSAARLYAQILSHSMPKPSAKKKKKKTPTHASPEARQTEMMKSQRGYAALLKQLNTRRAAPPPVDDYADDSE